MHEAGERLSTLDASRGTVRGGGGEVNFHPHPEKEKHKNASAKGDVTVEVTPGVFEPHPLLIVVVGAVVIDRFGNEERHVRSSTSSQPRRAREKVNSYQKKMGPTN